MTECRATVKTVDGQYSVKAPSMEEIRQFSQWVSTVAELAHDFTEGGRHSLGWPGQPPHMMARLLGVKEAWTGAP